MKNNKRHRHTALRRAAPHFAWCVIALLILAGCSGCAGGRHAARAVRRAPPKPHTTSQPKAPIVERGEASYYSRDFAGHSTASGETFNPKALTAAHRTLPLGTRVKVTDLDNARHVTVRINDRGPYSDGHDRIIDLSYAAAKRLHMLKQGTAPVRLQVIE